MKHYISGSQGASRNAAWRPFRENVNAFGNGTVLCFQWSAKDWCALALVVHNHFMIITYANGTVLKAVVLTHEEHEIRAIAPGCDDVLSFACVQGAWTSEEFEPVDIDFDLEQRPATPPVLEGDCICPKELAARLIQMLFAECDPDEAAARRFVFSAKRQTESPSIEQKFKPYGNCESGTPPALDAGSAFPVLEAESSVS